MRRKGAPANRATRLTKLRWEANYSYVSLENALKRLHARQGSPPTRGTRLGGIAFYHAHVKGSCRAIPPSRGEINRENMPVRGEFCHSYHLLCYQPSRMIANLKRTM